MPLFFEALQSALAGRARLLDFLVALGTHPPLSDAALSSLIGRDVRDGRAGASRVMNHRWDDSYNFV